MLTPSDGARPRMRMYVFDANVLRYVDVVSPANIAGRRTNVGNAQFGQQVFNLTKQVVQPTVPSGCNVGEYAGVAGKFVLVDRQPTSGAGSCSIGTKLGHAMTAGAAGFILVNLSTTPNTAVTVTGSLPTFTIPFLSVTWNDAAGIKTELAVPNVVTATMRRDAPGADRDGTIDNQIIAHEWGHYLSNRLIGDANGINNQQAGGMGEGWGDFSSMILSVRADDISVPSNANWAGVYAMAGYVTSGGEENNGYYYGIRRYPYSTDLMKNPLTFKHIQNGNPLPVGPPVNGGADGANNSEVHNTGEVWATMLWECYAALLRDTLGGSPRLTFQQAQDRMRLYLVTSLKMTPVSPTFTEARDAVLAAAGANDPVDYSRFLQAFAKRGIGIGAVSPDRFDGNNATVTESFVSGKDLQFIAATLDDTPASCDHDGVLDNGETGKLTIALKNSGDANLGPISTTVTSSSPGVTVLNGGNLTFPASVPGGQTTATINVTLNGALNTVQQLNFTLTYGDPTLIVPTTRMQALSFRANTNITAANTATDTVESPTVLWTTGHGTGCDTTSGACLVSVAPFVRREVTAIQHEFFGADASVGVDEYLISPVFTVNGGGSFNVQFDHSWGFEFDSGGNYDGGVIEMSVNGGAYADIGTSAYNGTILNYSGNVNPLKGRQGFVKNSAGTVHTSLTQAVAPGSTVRIRFRLGTDNSFGADGWHIDNVAFGGVVETPFDTLVADSGCLLCPSDIAVNNDPNQCGAVVNYVKPTVGTVVCSPNTGSFFPVGMTTVTCSSNAAPNCTFKVTVTDAQLPTVTCPPNQSSQAAPGQTSLVVNYPAPTANDNCPGATASCTPPSGTAFPVGTTTVTCKATDAANNMSPTCSFTVNVCSAVTLGSLANGQAGAAYNQSAAASPAGSYTYQVTSGSLPQGLTLDPNTGAVTGTPTQVGSFNFRITATGSCSGFRDYVISIACGTITLPASLTSGTVGTAYNQSVTASPAGTYSYTVTSGTLPGGLSLNSSTGAITGTPTTAGSFSFSISAAAGICSGIGSYTLVIACPTTTLSPSSLPGGNVGVAYSQTLSVTPAGTYSFSVLTGTLPSGLNLNASTGVISGTPSATGTATFTIQALAANGCSTTQNYTVAITCPTVSVSPATLPNGTTGTAYSQTISATPAGGNYVYVVSSGSLPGGLSLNSSTGVLSGTPTTNGTFNFSVTATGFGSCASAPQSYSIIIGGGGCPTITLPDIASTGTIGSPYNQSAAASPSAYYTYSLTGTTPPGVTFYNAAALLYGYPTTNGSYTFTITATDSNNCTGSKIYTITIGGAFAHAVTNDFDGDGKSDLVVWRGKQSQWEIAGSADGKSQVVQLGEAFDPVSDVMACADYDGDGKYDLAFYRRAAGQWLIRSGKDGAALTEQWGIAGDVPVSADYDGDGKADLAVWRESESTWYIKRSSDGQTQTELFGANGMLFRDVPVPADYDGDGKTDLAVFRQGIRQGGHWYIKQSSDGQVIEKEWGLSRDVPVVADYDGDGKADIAVWRASDNNWYVLRSSDGQANATLWGIAKLGDVPMVGDYDGDGKADFAVWRSGDSTWYIRGSRDEVVLTRSQGQAGTLR
jgi:hypothetical protein